MTDNVPPKKYLRRRPPKMEVPPAPTAVEVTVQNPPPHPTRTAPIKITEKQKTCDHLSLSFLRGTYQCLKCGLFTKDLP